MPEEKQYAAVFNSREPGSDRARYASPLRSFPFVLSLRVSLSFTHENRKEPKIFAQVHAECTDTTDRSQQTIHPERKTGSLMETTATRKGYLAYQEAQAQELDQAKLILMMYAGAIRFLDKAVELYPANPAESGNYLSKAKDVILELMSSLDVEQGGDMGLILLRTYRALFSKLNEAHMLDDLKKIGEVRSSLAELEESWRQVFASPEYQRFKRNPQEYRATIRQG